MLQAGGSLLHVRSDGAASFTIPISAVPSRLDGLAPGRLLLLVGLDPAALRLAIKAETGTARQVLQLDLRPARTADQAIRCVLDDLAALALALWPDWYGGAPEPAGTLAPWRRAAMRLAAAGHPPRFRRTPPRVELQQLLAAVDPTGLILAAPIDPSQPHICAGRIAALEWCASAGASVVILSPSRPPAEAPFDRILYDAIEVTPPPEPVLERLIMPPKDGPRGSYTEKRMREALYLDDELSGLFEDEVTLSLGALGPTPRVDLLWRTGKVVVEIDGAEHERDPNYGADRHRDYELLVAGYLVLRLTNAEIAIDLGRSVDKIRRVVNLRRNSI